MLGLKALRARQLSRKGEHTAALAMCDMKDAFVLSRAGMHLTVLEHSDRPSIERALALGHVGQTEAALDMAQKFTWKPAAKALLGFLATRAPERVMQIIQGRAGLDNVRAYCEYITGDISSALARMEKLSPLHGMTVALAAGQTEKAQKQLDALFARSGLIAPDVDWLPSGINFAPLSCSGEPGKISSGPLISVVLTAHNEEKYLSTAVSSLLTQTWQNIELIIVNDASTDSTQVIAEDLARRDSRISIINLNKNVGLWAAKNIGLQNCKGEIITMHDADDWSHNRKLELQVKPLINNEGLSATSSYMLRIDETSGIPFTRNACNYLRWNPSSFMFRPNLIKECGDFLDNLLGSDCEFISRIETMRGASSHMQVKLPLSIGLQRSHSLSNRFRLGGKNGVVRLQHWESWRKSHFERYRN